MKIIVNPEILKEMLSTVSKAISNKPMLPVLSNVKFIVKDGKLVIQAYDMETAITTYNSVDVKKEGMALVPFAQISGIVAKSEKDLAIETNDNKMTVNGDAYTELNLQPIEDYPEIPSYDGDYSYTINNFGGIIEKVMSASSKNREQLFTKGVAFLQNAIVATNTYRFGKYDYETGMNDIIVPITALESTKGFGNTHLAVDGNMVHIKHENVIISARLLDCNFPSSILGKIDEWFNNSTPVVLDKKELLAACQRSLAFKDSLYFNFENNELTLKAKNEKGKILHKFEVDTDITLVVRLGIKNIIDGINGLDSDEITLRVSNNITPVIIYSEDNLLYKYIFAPMTIEN